MHINRIFIPIIKGQIERKKRLMAAQGVLPSATPVEMVAVLLFLSRDKDEEIKKSAITTLKKLPEGTLLEFASDKSVPPYLLSLLYDLTDNKKIKQALLINQSFSAKKLEKIAEKERDPDLLSLIAENQVKMLKNPRIAEKLIDNPALPLIQRKKVEEFFTRNFAAKVLLEAGIADEEEIKEKITTFHETKKEIEGETEEEPASGESLDDLFRTIKEEAESEEEEKVEIEIPEDLLKEEEEEEEGKKKDEFESLYKKINQMSVAEKVKLALLGNMEARKILIKDSNKIVALSVLESPKITIQEIRSLAQSKNVMDDILLHIARNKHWVKDYQIRLSLATNPKTPPSIAMRFLNTLRENDIKKIARDKNVPGYIARAAKRIITAREQRRR